MSAESSPFDVLRARVLDGDVDVLMLLTEAEKLVKLADELFSERDEWAVTAAKALKERDAMKAENDDLRAALTSESSAKRTYSDAIGALTARFIEVEAERDDAQAWVKRLTSTDRVLTCVYCGEAYPPGSPTHGAEILTTHIRSCEKHPMRAIEKERDALKAEVERVRPIVEAADAWAATRAGSVEELDAGNAILVAQGRACYDQLKAAREHNSEGAASGEARIPDESLFTLRTNNPEG